MVAGGHWIPASESCHPLQALSIVSGMMWCGGGGLTVGQAFLIILTEPSDAARLSLRKVCDVSILAKSLD